MPWLPADFVHPTWVAVSAGFHLRPIAAADTGLDYPAVMGSRERLWSSYGRAWGWPPASMTYEQDRDDLARPRGRDRGAPVLQLRAVRRRRNCPARLRLH